MSNFRVLKETSNTAKARLRQSAKSAEYSNMERSQSDMKNFRQKPYSVGKVGKENE